MRYVLRAAVLTAGVAVVCCGCSRSQAAAGADQVVLSAGGAAATVDRATGRVVSLRVGQGREEMARAHPAGGDKPFAYVQVYDRPSGRTYTPLKTASTIANWKVSTAGQAKAVTFDQQFAGAPFTLTQTLRETPVGLRWSARLRLKASVKAPRSVRVSWMLPVPLGWRMWGPNDTSSKVCDGIVPHRFVYAHVNHAPYGLVIPLLGVWGRRGGAAIFSPPDVQKCQIIFDLFTQQVGDPPKGVWRRGEDVPSLRVGHTMIGLRPGKDLNLAVGIAGSRPDWRGVMGTYVKAYPELFEPIPAARKYEGMYGISNASVLKDGIDASLRRRKVTCFEIHGHFPQYGEYVTAEALAKPDTTWVCRPHRRAEISVNVNRRIVDDLLAAGVGPFMYFYNVHANEATIRKRWPKDMMVGERNNILRQYHGEPALRAQPGTGFGKHLLEQMDLMLKAYPKAPGFFVDNFSIQWVSTAQDDGVTMVHDRPAYDMNRNHQDVGGPLFEKAHKAGKVIMVNKLATIESARGADMVLVEGMGQWGLQVHAFACAFRSMFPLAWHGRAEEGMKQFLIWGATPAATMCRRERSVVDDWRPLTDAMIGKRWVFDVADPVALPDGYDGQVFRIDRHAPHGGSVVVTVVDPKVSYRDKRFKKDLSVTVRLPEAGKLKTAAWLAAEDTARTVPCTIARDGQTLTVTLPPVGAGGVLRLSP